MTRQFSWPAARRLRKNSWRLDTFRQLAPKFPQLRLILVPRHPERFDEVAQLLDSCGCGVAAAQYICPRHGPHGPTCCWWMRWANCRLVGAGRHRVRRRQHGPSGRAEHDRTGCLRCRGQLWTPHGELPRHQPAVAGRRRGSRGAGQRAVLLRRPLSGGAAGSASDGSTGEQIRYSSTVAPRDGQSTCCRRRCTDDCVEASPGRAPQAGRTVGRTNRLP